jgi:hypothetical protein
MVRACPKSTSGALRLGNGGRCFKLVQVNDLLRKRLASVASFGHAMAAAKPPRTLEDWATEVEALQAAAKGTAGLGKGPSSYRALWIIRALLLCLVHQARFNGVKLHPQWTVSKFADLFPDQRGWVRKLATGPCQAMVDLLSDLGHPSRKV